MKPVWALPLLAASLVAGGAIAAAASGDSPTQRAPTTAEAIVPSLADPATEVLDLETERNRRFTIPVLINGTGPFDFMIDTGSQATAVTHQINDQLYLVPFGTATLIGMASRRTVEVVEVGSMTFGSHTVTDLVSPLLDREHVGADGILGLDSLQGFRVLIDFREETIALENVADGRPSRRGFEIIVRARPRLGQLLITDALVEGVSTVVIIDTGAQASLGNLALRDRLRAVRAQEVTTTDVNGVELVGEMSYVRDLTIEGLALRDVPLTFADTPAFEALGLQDQPVLSLGMQHLRLFDRVAIDFSSQRVLFDVPRDVARAMRQRNRGFNAIAR